MIPTSYWANAVLLLSAAVPIALADTSLVYAIVSAIVVVLGGWCSRRKRPVFVPEPLARLVIVAAFGYLVAEYLLYDRILVMALSHFLITVCLVRLLQARCPREDAQIVVLCLMLLVVGAIVSGNVSFVIALVVAMTVGLSVLTRLHMGCELIRTSSRSRSADVAFRFVPTAEDSPAILPPRSSLGPVIAGMGVFALLVGGFVFLACPRVESSFLRQFQAAGAGPVLTGFSSSMEIRGGETIGPSERPVMRVLINSPAPFSPEEHESDHYFRGAVSDHYGRRSAGLAAGWGWHRPPPNSSQVQTVELDEKHQAILGQTDSPQSVIEYQFWLEPGDYSNLFTPYPLLSVSSRDFYDFKLNRSDQIVRIQKTGKLIRYAATTVPPYAAPSVRQQGENENQPDPPLVVPEVKLPRADEILQSIDENIGNVGPLNVPANREAFLHKLEAYLASSAFTYSLTIPSIALGSEPIGQFLLNTRQGHCEYFASAMVIVCQLKGIQTRYVTGFRGGDFNPVGGFLIVRQKHAHAWVEAFVPGKGWMVFDPTPGASKVVDSERSWFGPVRTLLDFLQFQWANLVIAYDASARQQLIDGFQSWVTRPAQDETTLVGAVVAFVRELFGWRLEMSARDRLLYWVFTLLVLILILLVANVMIRAGRSLAGFLSRWRVSLRFRRSNRPETEFYYRFCRRLESLGLRRRVGQTPAEFAEQLAGRHAAFAAAPELVRLYYGLAYGNRTLSSDERGWVQHVMSDLNQADLASLRE